MSTVMQMERLQQDAHNARLNEIIQNNGVSSNHNQFEGDLKMYATNMIQSTYAVSKRITEWLGERVRKAAHQRIIANAYVIFANRHPEWTENCFDEHFVTHSAVPRLEAFLVGERTSATHLAEAWASQFHYSDENRQKAIAEIMPVASDFLYILETEAVAVSKVTQEAGPQFQNARYA